MLDFIVLLSFLICFLTICMRNFLDFMASFISVGVVEEA